MNPVSSVQNTGQFSPEISSAGQAASNSGFSAFLNQAGNLDSIFESAAKKYGVSADLLKAVGKAESGFNPNAVSRCGAQGVMQLMPATAASLGVKNSFDPEQNIMGGAKYLSQLLGKYDGNVSFALAAYNAGSGNVAKYGGIPPFKETQNYVQKVLSYQKEGVSAPADSINSSPSASSSISTAADKLFDYEDYLLFLKLYQEMSESKEEMEKETEDLQSLSSAGNTSYTSRIKFTPSVIGLLDTLS